jgi:hypothetical protein
VPPRTTPIISRRRRRARGREGRLRAAPAVGDRRRHQRHLERARLHLSLADGSRSERQFASDLRGERERASRRSVDPRVGVKAEAFGHRDQTRGSQLGPERREDRVARGDERVFERPAAFLAVGVAQLHAVERGVGGVREDRARAGEVGFEHACERDHLERRSGWLQAFEADARHREDLPARGRERHDAAVLATLRGHRRALQRW